MQFFATGVNHATAPLAVRERLAVAPEQLPDAIAALRQRLLDASAECAPELVMVSTCNRTEVVVAGVENSERVQQWLAERAGLSMAQLQEHCYVYPQRDAVAHLVRVASGLDSMILGEPQIFGQLKSAFAVAEQSGTTGTVLQPLFQHAFSVAKRVRSDTAIGENPVSVAFAAVALAQRIFPTLDQASVLLLGAGDTIELVARHLRDAGARDITVANRTLERAQSLEQKLGASAVMLAEVPELLPGFDIVISSTASQLPVLGKGAVESAIKARKHRPMFMVDLAVPRDIEAQVEELADVYLYTIDDLRDIIEQNVALRAAEVDKASELIDAGVERFMQLLRTRNASELLVAMRSDAEQIRDQEVERARQSLAAGKPADEVIEQLGRAVTQKLLHGPTVAVRDAAAREDKPLLEAARELFGPGAKTRE